MRHQFEFEGEQFIVELETDEVTIFRKGDMRPVLRGATWDSSSVPARLVGGVLADVICERHQFIATANTVVARLATER